MKAQRIAGLTALVSGVLLVLGIAAAAIAGPGMFGTSSTTYGAMGPWMIGNGQTGRGMMGETTYGGMMGFGASGPASTAIPGAAEVRVQAANFSFTPSEVRVPKGADVNLTLINPASSGVVHDLTVPALGIHIAANAGETRTLGLRGLPAGRYDAYCSVPGHAEAGMRATITVE
ncbi:MAG: cupredoxin domain-containing protein [Chloroflexi bacterium]|nr:cupredoxin domain-containing protein [Chloroflexota bacterium]